MADPFALGDFSVCLNDPLKSGVLHREMGDIFLPLSLPLASEGEGTFWGDGIWQVNSVSVCWPSYGIACCKEGAAP